jgi:hypothetical protein
VSTDGQESRGDIPYEPDYCECAHLVTLHVIGGSGRRGACSASTCACLGFVAETRSAGAVSRG